MDSGWRMCLEELYLAGLKLGRRGREGPGRGREGGAGDGRELEGLSDALVLC